MQGKAQIWGGIFVRRIKQRFFGQLVESMEAVVKLLDCAGKYAAATGGEQGIAAENVQAVWIFQQIADMAVGMAGGCPNGDQAFAKRELRTCGNGMRRYVDVAFAIDRRF